ncbi:MAG: GIDE domain-containing protein [Cellulosilyticaceae bacterium]
MEWIIFVVVLCGCVGYVFYAFKKADAKSLDIGYTQTTSLKDALEVFEEMAQSDPSYRHYVEIKGNAQGDKVLKAPFSGQDAIFYTNRSYSVTQETHVSYDNKGNKRTRTSKTEHELASEVSAEMIGITDGSCEQRVYIDMGSFEQVRDLTAGCDRFEQKSSPFARQYFSGFQGGSNFLGFRLKESILRQNQPLYVLGELYKMGSEFYLGRAHVANKTSMLSVKSEEQILHEVKKEKVTAIVAAAGILIAAFVLIF